MAFKSPGIYFTEIDNTDYQNPAAEINTTVAIVGFAKKGPINEPTEITSWSQFKNTFGSPITGDFAPLAVRNVLSYGGSVLFVRVADESLASQSAVVLKSASSGTDGKVILNRSSVPSTQLQKNGFYYGKLYAKENDTDGRIIWLRSPKDSYLSNLNMLQQFQNCLNAYNGFSEYDFSVKSKSNANNYRFFSFDNVDFENNDSVSTDYYVNLTAEKAKDGDLLAESINTAISNGTVSYCKLSLGNVKNSGEEKGSQITAGDSESSETLLSDYYFDAGISGTSIGSFYLITDDTAVGGQIITVKTLINSDNLVKMDDFVGAINNALTPYGVVCEFRVKGDEKYLLFFSTKNSTKVEIKPYSVDKAYNNSLFADVSADASAVSDSNNKFIITYSEISIKNKTANANGVIPVTVSYNKDSNVIVVTSSSKKVVTFKEPSVGDYLSQVASDEDVSAIIDNSNNYAIGSLLRKFEGQDASNIKVRQNESKMIEFYTGEITPGKIENVVLSEETEDTFISTSIKNQNLLSLFNNICTDYSDTNKDLELVLTKYGTVSENADDNARLGFIAKEMGEGTTDIGIEIYTSTSPLDEVTQIHYVDLFVSGIKKESWEDVSFNPSDSNFIATLMNQDPLNGGSAYVTVVYTRGNNSSDILNIKDTASYTTNGIVYLGQDLYNGGTAATTSTNLSDIKSYDYAVGNNGAVTDSTALYLNVLDTTTSGLCNKDLYSWHILITPDNISAEVQDQAITLCEEMDDGIYIADPPEALTRKMMVDWHNGKLAASDRVSALNSNFCCTYWPWVKIYDATSSKYVWAPPSVVMAPQFCKVDNSYAPWYAPAGETNGLVSTVIDIEESPNKTDRDALYLDQNRVNPFLKLRNGNILAYGEKTCQRKNSTLTKIHTRRMLIALKKELRNAIKGYIFMPTMTENITQIRSRVTSIMETYKQGGGVDSYVVVCDDTNNTTETLQQDILNIAVSCVPTGCIEQVEISLTLNRSAEA